MIVAIATFILGILFGYGIQKRKYNKLKKFATIQTRFIAGEIDANEALNLINKI